MNKFFIALSVLFLVPVMVSCNEKDVPDTDNFEGIYYDENTSDRQYLESVGNEILKYINPGEQGDAIRALKAFVDRCNEYAFPDNFYGTPTSKAAFDDIAQAVADNDYYALSRAVNNIAFSLANVKGLYQATPDTDIWKFIENRDELVLRYWINNSEFNFVINGMGSTWTETFTEGDTTYKVDVPQVLDIALISGSISSPAGTSNAKTLITAKINSDGADGKYLNAESSVRFANIEVVSSTKCTNTQISDNSTLYHHNTASYYRTTLLSTEVKVYGSGLCSIQSWLDAANDKNPLGKMVSSANSVTMIFKSLQVKTNINDAKAFFSNVDNYYDKYDGADPQSMAEHAAKILTQSSSSELRYCSDKNNKVRGTLGWEAFLEDDYEGYQLWGVRPTLTFASDGATFDFESFFGGGRFLSIENKINSIARTYRSYWR